MRLSLGVALLAGVAGVASACSEDSTPPPREDGGGVAADSGGTDGGGTDGGGTDSGGADSGEPGTDAGGGFESFRIAAGAGPCQSENDCSSFTELSASGLLRVDKFGETPVVVHEATISADDLQAAIPVLTDPALIALLDGSDPVCNPPTDVSEQMTLVIAGAEHEAQTTHCDQAPIAAARMQMRALAEEYAP